MDCLALVSIETSCQKLTEMWINPGALFSFVVCASFASTGSNPPPFLNTNSARRRTSGALARAMYRVIKLNP